MTVDLWFMYAIQHPFQVIFMSSYFKITSPMAKLLLREEILPTTEGRTVECTDKNKIKCPSLIEWRHIIMVRPSWYQSYY